MAPRRPSRAPSRPKRRPLGMLAAGLVVLAGMWLAGALAAAAGWPLWSRWLVAALVWPILPVALLIFISPRLGLRRVSIALVLVGAGACGIGWRAGLLRAVTTHAAWMMPATAGPTEAGAGTPTDASAPIDAGRSSPIAAPPIDTTPPSDATPPSGATSPLPIDAIPKELPVIDADPQAAAAREPSSRCFRAPVRSDHSDHAYGTTLADMDGDGILDAVAIESSSADAIRVWKGDRAGHFTAASTLAYDRGGLHFAVVDVDGDGVLDVATADHTEATVTLWLGVGDGSLRRGDAHRTYRSPLGIWAADVDVDGFADLIVAHYFHVEVLRGAKRGALRTTPWLRLVKQADPGVLLTPEDIVAADLDRDGLLELVIPKGDVTSIEVWRGRGRGRFARSANVESCYAPSHALVGDVVEDGAVDVVVDCGGGYLQLFAGDGAGGLADRGRIGPADVYHRGALVDLDGDGHLDLIAPTIPGGFAMHRPRAGDRLLAFAVGDGKGGFREVDTVAVEGFQHRVVAVVDVDGDEREDLVYECFGQSPGGHLGVAFGVGCGG